MTPAGLLLAAGAGTRLGLPKALARDGDGTSFLDRSLRVLDQGGCHDLTVVLGSAAAQATGLLRELGWSGVRVVVADDWHRGMSASLRAGLRALSPDPGVQSVLVTLVDLPDVDVAVLRRVLAADVGPTTLARASYDGRVGHPVLIGRAHWTGVLETASGDQGARDYLAVHPHVRVECRDLASGRDVDRPEDLRIEARPDA